MLLIINSYGELLLRAMLKTLEMALCGLFFACILGLIFGLLSVVHNKVCNIIAVIFVDVIRGVPMIVLAYFVFFGVPYCFNKMMAFLSTEYSLDWSKITHLEKAVYEQTLGRNFDVFTKFNGEEDLLITVEHKEDSQAIFAVNFDKDAALYWTSYVRAFLKLYKVDYDI